MAVTVAGAVILTLLMLRFDPGQIRVGRFPALHDWISRLLAGQFPYISPTRPSGFPVLFLIAMPFYWLGDLGFLQILAFLIYALLVHSRFGTRNMNRFRALLMLTCAPVFLYEIVVRSDLFSNMVLIIVFLDLCEDRVQECGTVQLMLLGLAGGLLLATRGIVLIIYVMYFGFLFKNQMLRGLTFACGVLAGFLVSLAPFAIWNWRYFIERGPFAIQASYLPLWLAALMIVISTYVAHHAKTVNVLYKYMAAILFAVVSIAFLISVINSGWHATVLQDGFDISYFCFMLPFLILALDYRTDVKDVRGRMFSTPASTMIS